MKYDIQEYGVAPEQAKSDLVRRNEAFIHAVESAIKLGVERPLGLAPGYGTERPGAFSAPLHISIDNGPNRERLKSGRYSQDQRRRDAADRIAADIARAGRSKPAIGCFTVIDLDESVCHWPSGDIYAECVEHRFCGQPIARKGVSYCAPHYRMSRPVTGIPATETEPA